MVCLYLSANPACLAYMVQVCNQPIADVYGCFYSLADKQLSFGYSGVGVEESLLETGGGLGVELKLLAEHLPAGGSSTHIAGDGYLIANLGC
ncbi:hypothetical protein ES703_75966 [subsurface metagenome]